MSRPTSLRSSNDRPLAEGGFVEERRQLPGAVDQSSLCQKWHMLARTSCFASEARGVSRDYPRSLGTREPNLEGFGPRLAGLKWKVLQNELAILTDSSLSPVCLHAPSLEDLIMRCVTRRSTGDDPDGRSPRSEPSAALRISDWSMWSGTGLPTAATGVSREESALDCQALQIRTSWGWVVRRGSRSGVLNRRGPR
jgi:hypothetical protein